MTFTQDEAIGYISAMIDGEGWIPTQKPDRGRKLYRIDISNTETDIVEACVAAYETLGVKAYVNFNKRGSGSSPNWKPVYHVLVTDQAQLRRLHSILRLGSRRKQQAFDEMIDCYKNNPRKDKP